MPEPSIKPSAQRMPPQGGPGSWKQGFPRRLGIFLLGIAIGLMLLGFFHRMKTRMAGPEPTGTPAAAPAEGPAAGPGNGSAPTSMPASAPATDDAG